MKRLTLLTLAVTVAALTGCNKKSGDLESADGYEFDRRVGEQGYVSTSYIQLERLARPAVNEGFVFTNDYLNAFNAVEPRRDLTTANVYTIDRYVRIDKAVAEAATVIGLVTKYGKDSGLPAPTTAQVAAGFLPDVMRVDFSKSIPVGKWSYNGAFEILDGAGAPILTGGRKPEDDVVDITLTYLLAGATNVACGPQTGTAACAVGDGVTYDGGTSCGNAGQGSNPANPGHRCLEGQSARNGGASFPYLASPN